MTVRLPRRSQCALYGHKAAGMRIDPRNGKVVWDLHGRAGGDWITFYARAPKNRWPPRHWAARCPVL